MRRGGVRREVGVTTGPRSEAQLRADTAIVRPLLAGLGGRIAVQIGAPAHPCLDSARFTAIVSIDGEDAAAAVRAQAASLPLPSSSIDVVVLMHTLYGTDGSAAVIREATRVLRGEGRLVVVELRPLSLAGLAAWFRGLRTGLRPTGAWRLRALMAANGLAWGGRKQGGAIYVAQGVRRIASLTPMRPSWVSGARRRRSAVGVPGAGHAG